MPRMARIVLPTYPHHVVQRGHNRQATFAEDADDERYLATLQEYKTEYRVSVFAWCLMTNHVHLLLAPEDRDGLGKLMKRLAGRQTRYYNKLERRSGTLWEGRYKSSLVQSDAYRLACCRYIELNPVRARIVVAPDEYRWSSCRYSPPGRAHVAEPKVSITPRMNWCTTSVPRQRLLKLSRQAQQGGLITETADQLHPHRQVFRRPMQR